MESYLVAEVAAVDRGAVIGTDGAVVESTAAVAHVGSSRSQGGHADGDGQDGLDGELHLDVCLG